MLVNLSPKNNFQSMSEQHTKCLSRYDNIKRKARKFSDFFEPTEYTGVYWSYGTEGSIKAWCKQMPVYKSKGYRSQLSSFSANDISAYMAFQSNAWTYGVADNLAQIVDMYYTNETGCFSGNHVIFAHRVSKDPQSPCRGWRWHKHGEYIGTQQPKCEYLNDEPEIQEVIVFSIYKVG